MISVEELMIRIEKRLNPYFYDHISGYEVKFGPESEYWSLRKIPKSGKYGGIWIDFSVDTYSRRFNDFKLDIYAFQQELHRSCLTEAVYHKMAYDSIRKALGDEAVDAAEADFRAFGDALIGAITKVVKRRDIKLV